MPVRGKRVGCVGKRRWSSKSANLNCLAVANSWGNSTAEDERDFIFEVSRKTSPGKSIKDRFMPAIRNSVYNEARINPPSRRLELKRRPSGLREISSRPVKRRELSKPRQFTLSANSARATLVQTAGCKWKSSWYFRGGTRGNFRSSERLGDGASCVIAIETERDILVYFITGSFNLNVERFVRSGA